MGTKAWLLGCLGGLCIAATAAAAPSPQEFDTSAGNLIAVLRETADSNQVQETLEPFGAVEVELPDGKVVAVETSWFHFVGDMHIRLVFDSRTELQSASPEDLQRLRLEPRQALELATANLRRMYGEPVVQPWDGRLRRIAGRADDLNSSYFIDRAFWARLESAHPAGLVVAVPQRGGLLFAPADDAEAVATLRFSAVALYSAASRRRVSSALYLFKDGHWSVFQPPLSAR